MNSIEYRGATNIGLDYVGADGKRMTTCQLVNKHGTAIATANFVNGQLVDQGARPEVDFMMFLCYASMLIRTSPIAGYSKCPACGYYAFNGQECFDCGYRP